jgi:hypothetical protein
MLGLRHCQFFDCAVTEFELGNRSLDEYLELAGVKVTPRALGPALNMVVDGVPPCIDPGSWPGTTEMVPFRTPTWTSGCDGVCGNQFKGSGLGDRQGRVQCGMVVLCKGS